MYRVVIVTAAKPPFSRWHRPRTAYASTGRAHLPDPDTAAEANGLAGIGLDQHGDNPFLPPAGQGHVDAALGTPGLDGEPRSVNPHFGAAGYAGKAQRAAVGRDMPARHEPALDQGEAMAGCASSSRPVRT